MEYLVNSPKTLGQQLKHLRKEKGLSQTEAGNSLNITQSVISGIENGAPGTQLETLFRVLAVLDLEMVIRPKLPREALEGEW